MNQIKTVELAKVVNWGLLTFVMFWTGLVILCSLYMTIPLLSVFAEEFTITANQAAWAGSIFSIFFAIGCVFFGIMSEKFGLKRVMVFGLLCLGALTILVGFASDFRQLLIFRALQGIASATFSPVAITYIGKVFPPERRVTTLGFLSTGFLFAGIVGQLVSSFIEPRINWQTVFYFFGVVYFITVLLLLLLPQDVRDKNKDLFLIMKRFKIPFQQKPIIITYFISITILLTFVGMYTALGESLKQNFNFNDQQIFLVRAAGGIGILISPFTGKLAKKFSIYPVVYSGFLLAIIGLFSMGFSKDLIYNHHYECPICSRDCNSGPNVTCHRWRSWGGEQRDRNITLYIHPFHRSKPGPHHINRNHANGSAHLTIYHFWLHPIRFTSVNPILKENCSAKRNHGTRKKFFCYVG